MKLPELLAFSLIVLALIGTFPAVHADDAVPSTGLTKHQIHQANWRLEKSVRKQLDKSLGNSSGILIVARSGAVTLDGEVTDEQKIDAAGKAASTVPGVTSVKNNLKLHVAAH